MKTVMETASVGRRLGLVASIITLLGGFSANAATLLILNETYDPPWLPLAGWEGGVENVSRDYVSEGVGGSIAVRMSAKLVDPDAYVATTLFQSGVMGGNDLATRENTVLSFDIKIDRPGMLNVSMELESLGEYMWTTPDQATSSVGTIPLGSYKPGVFKRIVVRLDDPLWVQNPYSTPPYLPLFEPSGRTYNQIALQVDSGSLLDLGQFAVTIDNLQVSTKNAMIPFEATSAGEVALGSDGFIVTDHGNAEHVGSFKGISMLPYAGGLGSAELTAANGDKLLGSIVLGANAYDFGVQIENGTGRFIGARGSYRGLLTWDPTLTSYTATIRGSISTVGSNKQ
jgi:hypothetical protein